MSLRFTVLGVLAFFLFISGNVQAQERYTSVKLIPERTAVKAGEEIWVATEISLAKDWHVYWLNPGDSGIPVSVAWNLPENFEISSINWPTPDKISYDILLNYGYYDQVTLLQKLKLPPNLADGKTTLTAKVDMLVCNEICIPESSTVSIDLNDPSIPAQDNSVRIKDALIKIPEALTEGNFIFTESNDDLLFTFGFPDDIIPANGNTNILEFFPKDLGIINHIAHPDVRMDSGILRISHPRGDQPTNELTEISGLLVAIGEKGQNKGYEITLKRTAHAEAQKISNAGSTINHAAHSDISLLGALLFAIFGGLILNLMPCVFPVLSMKALSLVKMSEKEVKIARRHGLAYTSGVILSFLLIGGLLLLLKSSGAALGWGFQLQNPVVVAILAYLLFMVGLNLIGFFEVGTRLGNLGDKLTRKSGLSGSFFTGILATVVATPCTAPFMSAALGFALLQPPIVSLGIFAALGFGLALPYLLLSFMPALRGILPRPGAWMSTFKQFLAFPMFASTIWLVWVVAQQLGTYSILVILGGMLSLSMSVWLSHKKGHLAHIFTYVFIFLPTLSLLCLTPAPSVGSFGSPFSKAALEDALSSNDPVFVEMTAAWCITCKLNHATSLDITSTKKIFAEKNVRYLIGDWTNYNPEITEYLNAFERDGVPIYVFYGAPDAQNGQRPAPKILPQVLTPALVEQAIEG